MYHMPPGDSMVYQSKKMARNTGIPGEVIVPPVQDMIGELKRSMNLMISNMHNIEAFRKVYPLTERILDVEFQLGSSRTPSSTTSSGSEFESSGSRRKRCIPIELQVHCTTLLLYLCLHMMHFV